MIYIGDTVKIVKNFPKYKGILSDQEVVIRAIRDISPFTHVPSFDCYVEFAKQTNKFRKDGLFIVPQRAIKEIRDGEKVYDNNTPRNEIKEVACDNKSGLKFDPKSYLAGYRDGLKKAMDAVEEMTSRIN